MNDSRPLDLILLLLRLGFGTMMILQHGLPKLEKLFWGDPARFADPFGFGAVVTLSLAVIIEVICSLLLILGLLTRISAIPLILLLWIWLDLRVWRRRSAHPWRWRFAGLLAGLVLYVALLALVAIPFGRDFGV